MSTDDVFFDRYANTSTGISDTDIRTLRAMTRRFNLHTKEFHQYWNETKELLKRVFQTKNTMIGITGSIRIGFDAILSNVIEPGDKVVALTNGYWGDYIPRVIKSFRGEPVIYQEDPRIPLDLTKVQDILRQNNDAKAVAVVHVETDTGIANNISKIGEIVRKEFDALYIVDCATSMGGMEVKVDDWKIDFCFSGSHKCLTAPVGLAFISISEKGWNVIENRKTPIFGQYNDLIPWKEPLKMECEPPIPTMVIHAVRATLDWILSLDLKEIFKMHKVAAEALRCGLIDMGLQVFPDCSRCDGCNSNNRFCSDVVTTIPYPQGVKSADVERIMGERYHLSVTSVPYRPDCIQFGTINELQMSPDYILKLLTTLGLTFSEIGVDINLEKGIKRANRILFE
ncbi:MAG: aminotransferase class V-fold PLP-dependent enzyme [Candidatus Bathyarchaeota archaeon]|nr:aminotransferase class V-fold PLP-dependent enzyme [Candidatus Bathyarchaeota archaeon]